MFVLPGCHSVSLAVLCKPAAALLPCMIAFLSHGSWSELLCPVGAEHRTFGCNLSSETRDFATEQLSCPASLALPQHTGCTLPHTVTVGASLPEAWDSSGCTWRRPAWRPPPRTGQPRQRPWPRPWPRPSDSPGCREPCPSLDKGNLEEPCGDMTRRRRWSHVSFPRRL